jgi:iron complex outermembrane receptor protein
MPKFFQLGTAGVGNATNKGNYKVGIVSRQRVAQLIAVLVVPTAFGFQTASAQDAESVEAVTVTGTSIRGIAPIGSNVITVDEAAIKASAPASMVELLSKIPALSSSGGAPQGQGYANYYAPNIHQLAASASNSTLVLMDGRRLPQGGEQHSQTDPGIIPVIALERVDVLADGASSIYGSDAVAGVVNFITRSHYDGALITGQAGVADGYQTWNTSLLVGKDWDSGWIMAAGSHSFQSHLTNAARPFTAVSNYVPFGGLNNASFNCSPAAIKPAGSSAIYPSVTSTAPVANTGANAPCDYAGQGDDLPQEQRDNILIKGSQQFGRVTVSANIVYDVRQDFKSGQPFSPYAPGTVTSTVFATGPQANSFYMNVPGSAATSETVYWSASGLVPLALNEEGANTFYANAKAEWNIDDNFVLTVTNSLGKDYTFSNVYNLFCASCANLALNGTTNGSGSLTTPSIAGTQVYATNLPLNASNELDVWNPPGSSNRTSAAVIASLTGNSFTNNLNNFEQLTVGLNGNLFSLPAGPVKVAAGLENFHAALIQQVIAPNGTGTSQKGSLAAEYRFAHTVQSVYAELAIPLVSPNMNVPLMQKFDIDLSGRHDEYSDVGGTTNPKVSASWQIVDGFKLVSNYATSFVAPSLDSIGDPSQSYNAAQTQVGDYANINGAAFNIPTAAFPGIAGVLPGCAAAATVCQAGTAAVPGITFYRGGANTLKPQTGNSWSIGAEITPSFLPGFVAQITYFNNKLKGGVLSPSVGAEVSTAALQPKFTVCPTGCTQAQITAKTAGLPLKVGTMPTVAYFLFDFSQANVLYLDIGGIDLNGQYSFDTALGTFTVGDSLTEFTRYNYAAGLGANTFSILNTAGYNANFPSVQTRNRLNLGWTDSVFSIDAFVNFTGSYRMWGAGTVNPLTFDANRNPNGGGDKVDSLTTLDLHAAYNFLDGILGGDQIYIDAKNLFDTSPPFIQGTTAGGRGYDRTVANPLGRVISVGLSAKF